MRHLRLVLPALAFVVAGTWGTQVMACDKHKATAANVSSSACTAEMAAKCTPEMMAACKARGAKSAAVTASAEHCAGMKNAVAASSGTCASKATSATASFSARASKTTGAVVSASDHCAGKSAAVTIAAGNGAYPSKGKVTAMAAGAGGQCSGHGAASMASKMSQGDCDACADMAMCDGEIETAGARLQVVPLKNGVMFVYTAENPGKVNAVQSALARRNERLQQIVTAGDKARLCAECKSMRGSIASGKLSREVVNIEGGALTLMTSNDPSTVKKIHAMVDVGKIARATKS